MTPQTISPISPVDFLFGANLPWIRYGTDFGANAWWPDGGVGDDIDRLDAELGRLAQAGVRALRWFVFCDGRAGIRFDASGRPLGLDDLVFRDFDAAIACAAKHDLRIMFVLLDYVWCEPANLADGVQVGGRSAVIESADLRDALLGNVFRPLLERYANEPVILAWDIMNEPEWITTGLAASRKHGAVRSDHLYQFFQKAAALVHTCASQPVTIGSAGAGWREFYAGLDLDFYQVHWYDSLPHRLPVDTPVESFGFDRPVLLGEFPTRGSKNAAPAIVAAAAQAGYSGAFYWSALSNDACSDPDAAAGCGKRA